MDYVEVLSFAILINSASMESFHLIIGHCQGYPLSPYLFIFCADVISHALRVVIWGSELEPYWSILEVRTLPHLLFIGDAHLLVGPLSKI